MKPATILAVGVIALMPCWVGAEIRMDERYGVLYVRGDGKPSWITCFRPTKESISII